MTKRNHRFEENNNKKPKLDNDIDALWGDDLDESVLDVLATQVEVKASQNDSILPSYTIFKEPDRLICSTQMNSTMRPSTSNYFNQINNRKDHNNDLELLRKRYEERDGEVAILRNQIKEMKARFANEQQQSITEWRNKVTTTEKQVLSVKSELEFKNLEIVNLKQKLSDVVKGAMNMSLRLPDTRIISSSGETRNSKLQTKTDFVRCGRKILNGNYISVYPLKDVLKETFLVCPQQEKHFIDTKQINACRNSIPYLQNQQVSARIIVERSKISIDTILPTVLELIKCSKDELDMDTNIVHVNKVLCVAVQYLINLRDLLDEIKHSLRTEDILEIDSDYLRSCVNNRGIYSYKHSSINEEIGVKASFLMDLISGLIEHNKYLRDYLCLNYRMKLQADPFFDQFQNSVKKQLGHDLLDKIVNIVKITGEIRRVNIMSSFLSSSVKLFVSICKTQSYDNVKDIVCKLTKELIFLRPPCQIVFQMTELFKECSLNPSFVEFLLNKSKQNVTSKKGVVYFNEDACRFYIYVLLFDNCTKNMGSLPVDITLNMLSFIYNTYKSSYWLHHQNIKECDCLPQLYKLIMEIIYRALERYIGHIKKTRCRPCEWDDFFRNKVISKVLNLMMFHSDELTEKYITVFSQYKEIEQQMQERDLGSINTFNISDDLVSICSNKFDAIDF